jgi:hypothetical protein
MLPLLLHRCPSALRQPCAWLIASSLLLLPLTAAEITPGKLYPSNSEQYTLQLINRARMSTSGLAVLGTLVSNNLNAITPSTTRDSMNGTPWSANYWTSPIPDIAYAMNFFRIHPGDLKRQYMDLVVPGYPLSWNANLGNVASGYNDLVIASQGNGSGFPHSLAPYADQSTFPAFAKRYLDGGYGPLNDLSSLGENIAQDNYINPLSRFAAFMIDWGYTPNGIQDQNPDVGSHRLNIMDGYFEEAGVSSKPGWSTGRITEVQEFGARFSTPAQLVGAVYVDKDGNSFYTPGEGVGGLTITATPISGGTALQTRTYASGGYALDITAAGTYRITVAGTAGIVATVAVATKNVALDVRVAADESSADLNGDGKPDYVLYHADTRRTLIYYLNGLTKTGQADGPTLFTGWVIAGVADFDGDGNPDYLLYNPTDRRTAVWYLNGAAKIGPANGPVLTAGWTVAGLADFNRDGHIDYLLYQATTGKTAIWYLNGMTKIGSANGPVIPTTTTPAGAADFNSDGFPDLLLFNPSNRQTTVWYLNNATKIGSANGPTLFAGWEVTGLADFNADGQPDFMLYSASDRRTAVWYLNGVVKIGPASGPVLPAGWTLVSP